MESRSIFRVVMTVIAILVMPVIYLNIEKLAERQGWDMFLTNSVTNSVEGDPSWIVALAADPLAAFVAVAVLFFTLGLWVDFLFKKLSTPKPSATGLMRNAYHDADGLKDTAEYHINHWRHEPSERYIPRDFRPNIRALYIKLKKLRIKTPKITGTRDLEYLNLTYSYLNHMIPLLRDGHLKEARQESKSVTSVIHERLSQPDTEEKTQP